MAYASGKRALHFSGLNFGLSLAWQSSTIGVALVDHACVQSEAPILPFISYLLDVVHATPCMRRI